MSKTRNITYNDFKKKLPNEILYRHCNSIPCIFVKGLTYHKICPKNDIRKKMDKDDVHIYNYDLGNMFFLKNQRWISFDLTLHENMYVIINNILFNVTFVYKNSKISKLKLTRETPTKQHIKNIKHKFHDDISDIIINFAYCDSRNMKRCFYTIWTTKNHKKFL